MEVIKECIKGIDFTKESNILLLLMETMRYHPVVTTVPYWVKKTSTSTGHGWEHEAVCIDAHLLFITITIRYHTYLYLFRL